MELKIASGQSKQTILVYTTKSKQVGVYKTLAETEVFSGKANQVLRMSQLGETGMEYTVYCGIGDGTDPEQIRCSFASVLKTLSDTKVTQWDVDFDAAAQTQEACAVLVKEFAMAAVMTLYQFKGYKSEAKEKPTLTFCLNVAETDINQTALSEGCCLAEGVTIARDLGNRHASDIYPESLAQVAVEYGAAYGFDTKVLHLEELQQEGFGGILSVGQGSTHSPVLIVMEYHGAGDAPYHAYVGKGITFDAGGYCMKDSKSIVTMKVDMCGAANVLGLMTAVARNKVEKNVLCVIPAAENLIGSQAYLPGSVITMHNKKTVEITNTDAEGRLILADAIDYVAKMEKVERIVDIATLTGSMAMAFGGICCGVTSNSDALYHSLEQSASKTGEKVWRMPLFEDYKDRIVSSIADYRNSPPSPAAGAIVAGLLLQEFTQGKAWVHLDIAGNANSPVAKSYTPAGVTGFGVRLMYQLLWE